MDSHMKLLGLDLMTLTVHSTTPSSFSRGNLPITHIEVMGTLVFRQLKPHFFRFLIDDGSALIPCILWLSSFSNPTDQIVRRSSSSDPTDEIVRPSSDPTEEINREMVEAARLGELVRVRGKVSEYKGEVQITVRDLVVEKNPNLECLHWLECYRLARDCYDLRSYGMPMMQ